MAIYMKVDGVDGNSSSLGHAGGVNVILADGSVKFLRFSIGSELEGCVVGVSKISMPDVDYGFINTHDASASVKAGAFLVAACAGLGSIRKELILTLSKGAVVAENILREIAMNGKTIPAARIVIGSGGDSKTVSIELKNVKITSYRCGGQNASTTISLNFQKIA